MEITNQMKQQINILARLEKLLTEADKRGLTGKTSDEDRKHLKSYCDDMKRACSTAIELEKVVEEARKAEDKAKEEAEKAAKAKEKSAEKKLTAKKPKEHWDFLD